MTATAVKPAGAPGATQSETRTKQIRTNDHGNDCPTSGTTLRQPADGASNLGTTVTFRWDAVEHAKKYTVTYTVTGGNGKDTTLGTTNDKTTTLRATVPAGEIKWRVVTEVDKCGNITSSPSMFTTGAAATPPPATPPPATPPPATPPPATPPPSTPPPATPPPTTPPPTTNPTTPPPTTTPTTPPPTTEPTPTNPPADTPSPDPVSSCVGAPAASAVAQAASGSTYEVRWSAVASARSYIVDESASSSFAAVQSATTANTSLTFSHAVDSASTFFYRVRAVGACSASGGPASSTLRVVVLPQAAAAPGNNNDSGIVAPFGTTQPVTRQVVVNLGGAASYIATASETWMTVSPASGSVGADGKLTLTVSADPAMLQVGSSTSTISVTILGAAANGISANAGSKVVTIPISITLITPVSSATALKANADTLIIPAVAHADGNNSHWQSDLRITHTFPNAVTYNVVYVPSGSDAKAQQTTVTVNAGETIALDDVLSRWFGAGALGDSATGLIAIQPSAQASRNGMTFAASRLYNVTAQGSFGQYVPAVAMSKFTAASSGSELALTSLAQSSSYRTNFGLVEGSGLGASVLLSAFDALGTKLFEQMITLAAGEHRNLGAILAANGVDSPNVRVDAKVMSAQGSAFAYASVVDNATGDPLFIPAVDTVGMKATHAVIPGVAELATAGGRWQSDVRLFNPSPASVSADLSFFPQGATTPAATKQVTIEPGQVLALDNVLASAFGTTSASGAVHVDSSEPLLTNARTYNQRNGGTYGQFIVAATVDDATGIGERPLEILQLEESSRFRSNVGLAELTGHPVTVEVTATLPGHKLDATMRIDLGPNEFRQISSFLSAMGMTDAYNASLAVRVVSGSGRVTGYASVIDNATQDPTYVGAQ